MKKRNEVFCHFYNHWKDKDFYFGFNFAVTANDVSRICYLALHLGVIGLSVGVEIYNQERS